MRGSLNMQYASLSLQTSRGFVNWTQFWTIRSRFKMFAARFLGIQLAIGACSGGDYIGFMRCTQ